MSHNSVLINEILQQDWIPRLLVWLQPLPTSLPSSNQATTSSNEIIDPTGGLAKNIKPMHNTICNNDVGDTCDTCLNLAASTLAGSDSKDLQPLMKKRKNHELSGDSQDAAVEHIRELCNSDQQDCAGALHTLRLQHLHLQIGALWALTNIAAGELLCASREWVDVLAFLPLCCWQ